MTKQNRKVKAMLNYYQIDVGGTKSEKMTKKQKEEFLDRFNANYDAHTVQDILDKIRNKFPDKFPDNAQEKPEDDMDMNDDMEDIFRNLDDHRPIDDEEIENKMIPFDKIPFDRWNHKPKQSQEIEDFINWISSVLYSADHKVIITEDGLTTNIKLVKIKGGKKK